MTNKYQRVVLKVSGEALAGETGFGIDPKTMKTIAQELKEVYALSLIHISEPTRRS